VVRRSFVIFFVRFSCLRVFVMELQRLDIEELEQRIAPDSIHGVPGESNGNPGNEVSNGSKPQPGNNTANSHRN